MLVACDEWGLGDRSVDGAWRGDIKEAERFKEFYMVIEGSWDVVNRLDRG